jgi:hypothetical protein
MSASADGRDLRPWALTGVALAIAAEGLIAARVGYAAFQFQAAVIALAAGWITAAAGLSTWYRAPGSRVGPLLVAAGAAAFLPELVRALDGLAASIPLTWLAAAIVTYAILTAPLGRTTSRTDLVLVAGIYVVAFATPANAAGLFAAAIILSLGLRRAVRGPDRRREPADFGGLVLAAGIGSGSLLDLLARGVPANPLALSAAAFAAAALLVAVSAVRSGAIPARVTDLVLRIDPRAALSITEELRRLTGDSHLDVAFPAELGSHVDAQGRHVQLPAPDDRRTVTALGDGSGILIIHDRGIDAEPGMQAAMARAAELAGANARLLGELRAEAVELRASRLRLLEAEADERQSVGDRLRSRLEPTLDLLAIDLALEPGPGLRNTLAEVRDELVDLADGLHPRALSAGGLAGALAALAARSPVPVSLAVDSLPPLRPAVEAAGWFVCNEALANVAKHAGTNSARVTAATTDGLLLLIVADGGVGGADADRGTGIRGMRDRVEAVGGRLDVESTQGRGTVLRATLPLGQA